MKQGIDYSQAVEQDLLTFISSHPRYAERFRQYGCKRTYDKGEIIISQGDEDDDIFFLRHGKAKVVNYSEQGHEIWLAELRDGTTFGEMAYLLDTLRTSTVVATQTCEVEMITASAFQSLIDEFPEFWMILTKLLAHRLKSTSKALYEGLSLSLPNRVYDALLRDAAADPARSEQFTISPPPNVTHFSGQLNVSREAVSRAVSRLVQRGLVKKYRHAWHIINPEFKLA